MAGAGCSLMDAGRLKRAYQGIAGEMIAGWTLLSLAFTSAIVIIAATQTHEPRLAIALVFSAAFLVAGGTLYWFGRKDERSKGRKIRSVAQTEDDRDRSLVGHLDWRDGTVEEEEAQRPRRLWPAALAVAAGAPMLGLAATGAYGFGVFGAVFTGIGLFLAYRRWAGRRRMLKFGISVFILQDRPIRLKNGVVGRLLIPNAIGIRDVAAQLTCVKRRTAYRASHQNPTSRLITCMMKRSVFPLKVEKRAWRISPLTRPRPIWNRIITVCPLFLGTESPGRHAWSGLRGQVCSARQALSRLRRLPLGPDILHRHAEADREDGQAL